MKQEKSCGMILFTHEKGQIRYVIIQSFDGTYGFPKGHIEPGESEEETALRETSEEVGIRPEIVPGFRQTDEYKLPTKPDTLKQVVYFLGTYQGQALQYQPEELVGAWLLPFDKAFALLQFTKTREMLRSADTFIRQLISS